MTAYGPPASPARPPASLEQRTAMLAYAAGGLGVLSFVWGFLGWFSQGSGDSSETVGGYSLYGGGATAVIGVSLVAGFIAAARSYEKKQASLGPVALGIAALLLVIGLVVGKGSLGDNAPGIGMGIGLILELITVIVQAGVLVVGWLMATGKIAAPRPQGPPQQQYPGYQPAPQGYPQGGYPPPPATPPAATPSSLGGPPSSSAGGPPWPSYGPPAGYPQQGAPHQDPPQQGAPAQPQDQPQGAPQGRPQSQPQNQPQNQPQYQQQYQQQPPQNPYAPPQQ